MLNDNSASKYGVLSATPPSNRGNRYSNHSSSMATTTSTMSKNRNNGADAMPSSGLSFSNPVYELSNPSGGTGGDATIDGLNNIFETAPTSSQIAQLTNDNIETIPNVVFKVEHVLAPGCNSGSRRFGDIRSGLESRWRVAQAIYPYMVCISLAYCVTLSLYPGIESEIISCNLKSWMPVLLMFTLNTSDVIGKVMASFPYPWSRRQLILLSTMRIALVPLLLLCCAPRAQPVIAGETPAFIFSAALGITNGLAGSLPMMLAPAKVPATLKEVTGNMMTLSYNVGLTAGSLIGYVFDSMLGPQILNPCPTYPYIPKSPSLLNTTIATTSIATTAATTIDKVTWAVLNQTNITSTTAWPITDAVTRTTVTIGSAIGTTVSTLLTTITNSALDNSNDFSSAESPSMTTSILSSMANNFTTYPLLNSTTH